MKQENNWRVIRQLSGSVWTAKRAGVGDAIKARGDIGGRDGASIFSRTSRADELK
jgi:hypothetical protein